MVRTSNREAQKGDFHPIRMSLLVEGNHSIECHHQQVRMSRAAADSGFCSRFLPHRQAAAKTPLRFSILSYF